MKKCICEICKKSFRESEIISLHGGYLICRKCSQDGKKVQKVFRNGTAKVYDDKELFFHGRK